MALRIHDQELGPLRGSMIAPVSVKPVRAFRPGRVCDAATCQTVLSQYNRGNRCWQHESPKPFQIRVRPARPLPPAA
jgi:hypothetical protein